MIAMFYTVWAKGPTVKAAQRLDSQSARLSDKANFLLVNCAPGMDNFDIENWAERKRLHNIAHYKLLGPAPKYRPSNQKAALIIQGLARGYLSRKYNKYAQTQRFKRIAATRIQSACRVKLVRYSVTT